MAKSLKNLQIEMNGEKLLLYVIVKYEQCQLKMRKTTFIMLCRWGFFQCRYRKFFAKKYKYVNGILNKVGKVIGQNGIDAIFFFRTLFQDVLNLCIFFLPFSLATHV